MGMGSDMQALLVLAAVFAAVVALVYAVGDLLAPLGGGTARRRLARADRVADAAPRPSARFRRAGPFHRLMVDPLKGRLVTAEDNERHSVRRRLLQAGIYAPQAVAIYYVVRLLAGGGLPLLGSLLAAAMGEPLGFGASMLRSLVLGAVGYAAPALFLGRRIARRQRTLRAAFPDALDLLIVCVEAGLSLDAATARVGTELAAAQPLMSEHLALLTAELGAGRSREEAWRAMAARIGIAEISALVTLLVQSDALGTSMADALRSYAGEMRARRLVRAEELAQQMAVKMAFPLMLMILPAMLTLMTAPAIIQAYRTVLPALAGAVR